jgi:hypothetical protein
MLDLLRCYSLSAAKLHRKGFARRVQKKAILMAMVLVVFLNAPGLGTTIVAIRTPDLFAVAADGAGTMKGGGNPDTQRRVSKIFQNAGLLVRHKRSEQRFRQGI